MECKYWHCRGTFLLPALVTVFKKLRLSCCFCGRRGCETKLQVLLRRCKGFAVLSREACTIVSLSKPEYQTLTQLVTNSKLDHARVAGIVSAYFLGDWDAAGGDAKADRLVLDQIDGQSRWRRLQILPRPGAILYHCLSATGTGDSSGTLGRVGEGYERELTPRFPCRIRSHETAEESVG